MAITNTGKMQYNEEQYRKARYETSALDYAITNGYAIVNKGTYKSLAEHDSFVFAPNGMWFWNSRGLKGGAIEFLTQIEHKSLVEAVLALAGDKANESAAISLPKFKMTLEENKSLKTSDDKKEFTLPKRAKDFKRLYGYLLKERKLDSAIVTYLIHQKKLYLSAKYSNAVFVSLDNDGVPKAAYQRGTLTFAEKPFKMDVTGSDKSYPFHMPGLVNNCVSVFEGAVDAISHASLIKRMDGEYKDIHRISTGGITNQAALNRFLEWYPRVNQIDLCFDSDEAGQNAALKWSEEYTSRGYVVTVSPPQGKDYNDDLKQYLIEEAKTKAQATTIATQEALSDGLEM